MNSDKREPREWFAKILKAVAFVKKYGLLMLGAFIIVMFFYSSWSNDRHIKEQIQNKRDYRVLQAQQQLKIEKQDLQIK